MNIDWHGDIRIDEKRILRDILLLKSDKHGTAALPSQSTLRFLSFVATAQVPLHMVAGHRLDVTSSNDETKQWLSHSLLSSAYTEDHEACIQAWWHSTKPCSSLGILVGMKVDETMADPPQEPRITELLIYASRNDAAFVEYTKPFDQTGDERHPTNNSQLKVYALPLSSDLLESRLDQDLTPPASPTDRQPEVEAIFLPPKVRGIPDENGVIHRPPVKKRKSAADAFDEATERRRKAQRRGGESVAAAAALQPKRENSLPSLHHRRSNSNTQTVPLQTRPLSRSPSIVSARPVSAREASVPTLSKRSTLSRVESISTVPEAKEVTLETKNKDVISKLVMTGMRLYGLSQSKTRKSRANSNAATPAIDLTFDAIETERKADEEYKLVYHQAFKGTCFAFRNHVATMNLQTKAEELRETVDRLLAVFCNDPLVNGNGADDKQASQSRSVFGSAQRDTDEWNPFIPAPTATCIGT